MAFPWSTVIGVIPWTDLLKAAPELARRARRVLGRGDSADGEPAPSPAVAQNADEALAALAREVALLNERLRQSDEVLRALAEQHDALVSAGETMRRRVRHLTVALWTLAAAVLVLGCGLWWR